MKLPGKTVLVLAAGAMLLAGCGNDKSSGQATTPAPGTSSAAPSSDAAGGTQGLPRNGAPKVPNPLADTVLDRDPCTTIDPAGVQELLGESAKSAPLNDDVGKGCEWENSTSAKMNVQFVNGDEGLSSVYERAKPSSGVWNETQIGGFPAVAYRDKSLSDDWYGCNMAVGISDTKAINVGVLLGENQRGKAQACEAIKQVAEKAVAGLSGGA
ncbi:DUF3558 domain-containing protein [Amycolatopsis suaedae]|uniref:DUF3558 domain-containing protein n=1 Tax=Amycolatopsis suaedae TaxID=2510978 RepID=A0A4Q7J6W5_9PSEU|nr:DUF3558 domain-containing protein [Amycolatopsis suaedae]RZQ61754.1 DUF3558 domain-containing protein [Amycolatopsis suaedae]